MRIFSVVSMLSFLFLMNGCMATRTYDIGSGGEKVQLELGDNFLEIDSTYMQGCTIDLFDDLNRNGTLDDGERRERWSGSYPRGISMFFWMLPKPIELKAFKSPMFYISIRPRDADPFEHLIKV